MPQRPPPPEQHHCQNSSQNGLSRRDQQTVGLRDHDPAYQWQPNCHCLHSSAGVLRPPRRHSLNPRPPSHCLERVSARQGCSFGIIAMPDEAQGDREWIRKNAKTDVEVPITDELSTRHDTNSFMHHTSATPVELHHVRTPCFRTLSTHEHGWRGMS